MTTAQADVLALRVDPDGRIREVVVDLFDRVGDATTLADLLDRGSHDKLERMLAELDGSDHGTVREMVLAGSPAAPPVALTWMAWREDDHVLVVGATNSVEAASVHEELLRINNEQSNLLRDVIAEQVRRRRDGDSMAVSGLLELNNELAAVQRELARQNVTLARTNEEKDLLLGAVAHDLRNPLTAVTGLAEAVAAGRAGPVDERIEHLVSRIAVIARHMTDLVNDLVDLSAVASGRVRLDLEDVDVAAVVADVVELAGFAARDKDIRIEVEVAPGAVVRADRGKLQQVAQNLLDNAIKYSPRGSAVRLAVTLDGDGLRLAVHDEGVGIPAEELDQLFRPFGTTSATTTAGERSTGLGLAIVHRLVEAHGGRVGVESEEGVGSMFEVRLPLAGPAAEDTLT